VAATDGIFLARVAPRADGIRLGVKDLLDTAGIVTTYGSAIFADHVPARTARAVALLEAAGYATVGKTNLHEFAYGVSSENAHFGAVPNPVAPGRIAGGSSGGSAAALAAGLVDAALGTDSGGSIRIPSACCGTVGFKPTYGLVSSDGCFPLAPTFDHVGPMARTVEACERMLEVLAPGFEPLHLSDLGAVSATVVWTEHAAPGIAARVTEASAHFPSRTESVFDEPSEADRARVSDLFAHEVADVHGELYAEHADLYSDEVAAKIEACLRVTADDAKRGADTRSAYHEWALEATRDIDLVVTPTIPCVAPPAGVGEAAYRSELIRFTFPFNALGWPALALPCGPAEDGLPASIQLVGKPGNDALVLAAGRLLASLIRGTAAA
jgi:aspartyl-tRNA(Asn)/glutamyl-tRNA(Gln) amidotransferase subunit A